MVNDNFLDKKIIDFAVGEDITVVLLDTNEVYWSGSKLYYKPEKYFILFILLLLLLLISFKIYKIDYDYQMV